MKTFEDEWYIDIKANKFTTLEILREIFGIVIYCVSALSLHIESTDSMIAQTRIQYNLRTTYTLYKHNVVLPLLLT